VRLRRAYAAAGERDLGAGDRAQAEVLRRIRELERPVDAVVVGQSEGVIPELDRPGRELFRERRTVEERIGRVGMELDVATSPGETWTGRAERLCGGSSLNLGCALDYR